MIKNLTLARLSVAPLHRDFLAGEKAALAATMAATAAAALAVAAPTPSAAHAPTALVTYDSSQERAPPKLRAMTLADFKAAMQQVGPSVSNAEATMGELKAWNEMYGEGGNRRAQTLTYYM